MDISFLNIVFPAFVALVGFPALAAAVGNLLKAFGAVGDGAAPTVSLIFNLIGFLGVFYLVATGQVELLKALDVQLGILASFIVSFTVFAVETGLTKLFHQAFRGMPGIGYSFTLQSLKKSKK